MMDGDDTGINRIAGQGRLGAAAPVQFRFDGRGYAGRAGDTLASALLANGVRLVGRSFKYHRPRGIVTAGSEEPNALVHIDSGAQGVPNVRATMAELHDGLTAHSQNRFPSLKYDVMAVNDLISPFLGAGFYYKTFMWPGSFWTRLYEPVIRHAAGLGALSGLSNDETCDKAFAFCDLLVIGAGPTGLMAALTAGRAGADVILADEDFRMGGRTLAEVEDIGCVEAHDWAGGVLAELASLPNVRLMVRTTVTGAYDGGIYGALERVSLHLPAGNAPRECFWRITARTAILAGGAIERPIAFPNNDRPGIMMAGAVRAYLNRWGTAPGRRIAVFGTTADAQRTARDLSAAGVQVGALILPGDTGPTGADYPVFTNARVVDTSGRHGLDHITVEMGGARRNIRADCLAMTGGWNPAVHLTCHMGARPVWDAAIQSFVPGPGDAPGAVPGLIPAGAACGVFDTAGCLAEGHRAAGQALQSLGIEAPAFTAPGAEARVYAIDPLWVVEGRGRKFLDFQNDVHVKDIRLAAQESFTSIEHMKRYTTQGMATDQGKASNVTAIAVLADATGRTVAATGTTTFRPPYTPVSIAAMGAGAQGMGFAPRRLTTSHAASVARGAPMIEAGLWYRASYFPAPDETTWRAACDREVNMVRRCVGICDVSTLGKIDVQGPDAAAFLDFVYAGAMSTLRVGRVRYGLMLREDGHVMDDGTAARLNETHFVVTTTTGAAGLVMRHLDHAAQVLRPDLDVTIVSVTESWAQFSVAGPRARELLNSVLDQETTDAGLPYMGCGTANVSGVAGRIFRISFSGEQAFEVAVPVACGESLWRFLTAQADVMGGGPYGMEALNVLRIEKGFVTHAEIDGRVTATDLGMGRMVKSGDCIGQTALRRPGLSATGRRGLIGLRPVDTGGELTAGAHLFAPDDAALRENATGHVTSVCHSPTLGHMIALGFVAGGARRIGETVRLVDHLRGIETLCEIVPPVFVDADGGRMRG